MLDTAIGAPLSGVVCIAVTMRPRHCLVGALPRALTAGEAGAGGRAVESSWLPPVDTAVGAVLSGVGLCRG